MILKIKKMSEYAVIPSYAHVGEDACFDLTAVSKNINYEKNTVAYDIGLAFEIPEGYVGLIFPRSSVCKKGLILTNCVGVIDSGYRGSVSAVFSITGGTANIYNIGERVAQMMIIPVPFVEFNEVEELSDTARGNGGYGSTGK
jgi:dUTP pyrophosphatase